MALEISEIGVRMAVGTPGREAGEPPPPVAASAAANREALIEAEVQRVLGQLRSVEDR